MAQDSRLISAQDLTVAADSGQMYISASWSDDDDWGEDDSGEEEERELPGGEFEAALNDATESRRFVGVLRGLIDLMIPGQWNNELPMRLEIWSAEPPGDLGEWDHEVDADFNVAAGPIYFEASGGGPVITAEVPPGTYRVRISGRGLTDTWPHGDESYRLRLWPRDQDQAPELRKSWPGWDGRFR
jgi:hypothetical protein